MSITRIEEYSNEECTLFSSVKLVSQSSYKNKHPLFEV